MDPALLGEVCPGLPVVLIEGVLDGDDRVLLDETNVKVSELLAGNPLGGVRVGVLKVQVIFALFVEFGGSNIESDLDLSFISSPLDGLDEELERFLGTADVRRETSLITDVCG